jgi:hypothetical protein
MRDEPQRARSGCIDSIPKRTHVNEANSATFSLAYFQYKRRFEDPFFNLTRRHPEFFLGVTSSTSEQILATQLLCLPEPSTNGSKSGHSSRNARISVA